jgi:hypothetical protein
VIVEQIGVFELHVVTTRTGFGWADFFSRLRARAKKSLPAALPRCSRCGRLYQGVAACSCLSAPSHFVHAPEMLTGRDRKRKAETESRVVVPIRKKRSARA